LSASLIHPSHLHLRVVAYPFTLRLLLRSPFVSLLSRCLFALLLLRLLLLLTILTLQLLHLRPRASIATGCLA